MTNLFPQPGPLTSFRRQAMASDFEVLVNESEDARAADAALDALDEVDRVEEILSVFRPTSELSRLNVLGAEIGPRVSDELWNWLETALRLGNETEGAFDVACAPLWRAWGFAKREGEFPAEDKLKRALELSGARHLRLDPDRQTVAFDREGVELNFGAIGKGIALDLAAAKLEERGIGDFLVQGGKSGAVARGGRANDRPPTAKTDEPDENELDPDIDEESGLPIRRTLADPPTAPETGPARAPRRLDDEATGWTIGVAHPLMPEKRLGELWLRDRALATSGSTHQFFRVGGKRYSHVIDPRTGYPATGVLSATVLAPDATEADALSTAFFALGPEKTALFCERRPDIAALLVLEATGERVELATFNLDPELFRPL
ncbi:MAG: FAD:protein FMN transferase [Thermoguttaceae bacterium]|nr:FAD:protein FMN transferase [Thermoguttaceae bacterium]